ncbi:MAG: sigma-70 family RNA polymerase sigma factor [Patescibacteria group bacterium]|nr:sigma-70 family RNA polymerase sigma factor [Patescibacteria group bacterium]
MISDNLEHKKDEEIVKLILKNQDNFVYIVRRYEDKLSRYIKRISGLEKEDVEDLLQDVFIKVYQNLNDFDTSLKFSSWIYRIAHNETISNYRKMKSRPVGVSYDDDPALANQLASKSDFVKEIEKEYDAKVIRKVLAKMDKKYREVLILKFIEEKDYNEISDILQKPIGTVGAMINRGKAQFKKVVVRNKIEI